MMTPRAKQSLIVALLLAVGGWAVSTATQFDDWVTDDGHCVRDERRLLSGAYVRRHITAAAEDGRLLWMSSGPLTPDTAKPHGHWVYMDYSGGDGVQLSDMWFFHGELVTEAAFHRSVR